MNQDNDYKVITISNILRKITGLEKRSDLLMTEDLKDSIFKEIQKEINSTDKIIVNGIRQIEVLEYILEEYSDNNIQMYWIECDDDIRKKRFESRKSDKYDITIEEADERDNNMGLRKVLDRYHDRMIIIYNN